MKKQIILSAFLVLTIFLSQAQPYISYHKSILSGKYTMDLDIHTNDTIQEVVLFGNLPRCYQISIDLDVTEMNGTIHHIRINKYSTKGNVALHKFNARIQEIDIKSFTLRYAEFGEPYSVSWNQEWNQLLVTKSSMDYQYGSLFNIDSELKNQEKVYEVARDE